MTASVVDPVAPATRRPRSAAPGPVVAWTVAVLLLWLLVGPRVDLVGSLRVEDLVLALLGVLSLVHLRALGRPRGVTLGVLGVVAAGLVSAAAGALRGLVDPVESVLFAVRPLEYFLVFPAILLLLSAARGAWFRRLEVLLAVVTVLQTAFAVLQYYFGLPIGFSHAAYTRAAGLTVGPYELGAISAALLVYWAAKGRWVLASTAVVALAASISRISLLGAVAGLGLLGVVWALRARGTRGAGRRPDVGPRRSRLHLVVNLVAVSVAALVLAFTMGVLKLPAGVEPIEPPPVAQPSEQPSAEPTEDVTPTPTPTATPAPTATEDAPADEPPAIQAPDDSFATRLASTSVLGSWFDAGRVAATVPHVDDSVEYADVAYSHINDYLNQATANGSKGEPSNVVRFFRWNLLLNTVDDPADVVLGLGPSFAGPSVDGSYLRFYATGGLLGLLAWGALIVLWLRRSPLWMRCVTVSLLVGAVFIDIVFAQRPMVLYWALLALAAAPRPATDRGAAPVEPVPAEEPATRAPVHA